MRDCGMCNGTGLDEADFTGMCFACHGVGWVEDEDEDDERDEEEEYDDG
jgi:hypothetical protein